MSAHLDNTYGAAFIGMVVAAVLYGVSCVQAFYYYLNQNDTWHFKLTVAVVMFLDSIHQALITHTIYTYTIKDWGNPEQLVLIVWSLIVEVLFAGFVAFIVQSFLTLRIWRLSNGNIYITCISAVLVIGNLMSILLYFAKAIPLKTLADLVAVKGLSISTNVLGAAADLFIAATLSTLLNFSRTGFQRSDAVINKLIMFTVNTGLLTSLCALASLIAILSAPETYIYISFFFCLSRLYTNSLLATLNARRSLRGLGSHAKSDITSVSLRDFPKNGSVSTERQNISIKVDSTTGEYDRKVHESSVTIAAPRPHDEEDIEKGSYNVPR